MVTAFASCCLDLALGLSWQHCNFIFDFLHLSLYGCISFPYLFVLILILPRLFSPGENLSVVCVMVDCDVVEKRMAFTLGISLRACL